jgi:F-type H+-transporting ATPase subunit delta
MIESRIARKYATALFLLSRSQKQEDAVWSDLAALGEVLSADQRLLDVLAAPQISDEDKHTLVRAVLTGAHEMVVRFVFFAIDKRRSEHLPRMIEVFGQLLDEARGVVEASITSAVPLSDSETSAILARLTKLTGKTVRHRLAVDERILGGVVVIVGGEIIDHSVRHDLSRLRDTLSAVKVHLAA